MIDILGKKSDLEKIYNMLVGSISKSTLIGAQGINTFLYMQTLEVMVNDGWVIGKLKKSRPTMNIEVGGRLIRSEAEAREALKHAKATIKFAVEEPTE